MGNSAHYKDGYWQSSDGLQLHYRDYPGAKARPPLICIPGLTRNARDFEDLAQTIAPSRRVICVELRGRGDSDYAKDPQSYTPLHYVADLQALIAHLAIRKYAVAGTSLGGILAMLLAGNAPGNVVAAIINDIGPVIDPVGPARLKLTLGRSLSWPTWIHAARALSEQQALVYPDYDLQDWLNMAKRIYRLTGQGRIVPDHDLKISEAANLAADNGDLWPLWMALGDAPTLLVRGGLSDFLSAATAREMVKRRPSTKLVTISRVGHAPTLLEPAALRAVQALLQSGDK